jgi:hypothetical protein
VAARADCGERGEQLLNLGSPSWMERAAAEYGCVVGQG